MTPADTLKAAASLLRKLGADATPGPWNRPLNTRYRCTVTGALPKGERGNWIDGIDPATKQREQVTVATIPTWSNGRHSRQRGGRDLEYIAALHPGVGLALADWLETEAATWAGDEVHGSCSTTTCTLDAALAVARQLLGTTTAETRCDVAFENGSQCVKAAGHWQPSSQDPHVPAETAPAVTEEPGR